MKATTFLHIARDAWWLLAPILLVGVLMAFVFSSSWPVIIAGVLSIALSLFARDTDRAVPAAPLGIVAPLDGTVIRRRECHDPFLDRAAIRLSIQINRLGIYYLRAPTEGTLLEVRPCRPCKGLVQSSWIKTDEKDDVVLVVSQGSLLGQRPCNAGFGQRVGQGRRCGPRRFARVIDIYVPSNSRIDVELGQKVRAGSDVIATMVHNASKLEAA